MAKPGFSDVLIGLQYGDEGKAKVIDLLAKDYDIVARFNGGANAGHTIGTPQGGTVALNQIPSAIFHEHALLYIGSGCVINLEKLAAEIDMITSLGIDLTGRLHVSDQASVIQTHQLLLDVVYGGSIGTTKNGIGPCYSDKALRMKGNRLLNIRLGDLIDDAETFFTIMKRNYREEIEAQYIEQIHIDDAIARKSTALEKVRPYVKRDTLWLLKQVGSGKRVLFEGAQSVMLDVTKGSVPYVTSSATVTGGAYVGGDLPPKYHRRTIGVAKSIMSRVGNGPFASEWGGEKSELYCMEEGGSKHTKDQESESADPQQLIVSSDPFEIGIALRMIGNEYGTVSRRPRRVGMLDLVQLSYAAKMNGVDMLFLTKCDMLIDFSRTASKSIPVVTGYTLDGHVIDFVPGSNGAYRKVKTTVECYEPLEESITDIRQWSKLPKSLMTLLRTIESSTGCQMLGIGTGPDREQYVLKKSKFSL